MKVGYRITALFTAGTFLLCSCATNGPKQSETQWSSPQACVAAHTAGGLLVGALTGVLIAAVTGGKGKLAQGAMIGSAAGGALAFAYAWGKCFAAFSKVTSSPSQDYSKVRSHLGYRPSDGPLVQIRDAFIDPAAISPGASPRMHASYFVMTPKEENVAVAETLALKVYNPQKGVFEQVGQSSETVVVSPGERKATSEIPIPSNAEAGKFLIVFKVQMGGKSAEKEMPLTITSDAAILAEANQESALRKRVLASRLEREPVASSAVAEAGSKQLANNTMQIVVSVPSANIRAKPTVKSKIVAKASEGNRFRVFKSQVVNGKEWYHIKLGNGKLAWIIASACKPVE